LDFNVIGWVGAIAVGDGFRGGGSIGGIRVILSDQINSEGSRVRVPAGVERWGEGVGRLGTCAGR
jgi:hypothetical protein